MTIKLQKITSKDKVVNSITMESTDEPKTSRIYVNLKEGCGICWIFTVVLFLIPITYAVTTIVCCIPISCFNLCVFIVKCTNDEEPVKVVELQAPIADNIIHETYTYPDHIAIHMTENPLHIVNSIKINN